MPLLAVLVLTLAAALGVSGQAPPQRMFSTPEDAVRALTDAARSASLDNLSAIFGPDGKELVASSDPATARRNREVFVVAVAEGWHLLDRPPNGKVLVVGNEQWPFPVPLVKDTTGWRFDTAAGKEEVIDRRIGRNELAAIQICRTYIAAQRLYAQKGHDGQPAGVFARKFRSDPGRENGLYWSAGPGQKRSPLGELLANAAAEGRPVGPDGSEPSPFHGYYFKILTGQGPSAVGGARSYVVTTGMTRGFALVAWPAQYDVTGIMTFLVSHDGVVREKDLGSRTEAAGRTMTLYNPDASWGTVP